MKRMLVLITVAAAIGGAVFAYFRRRPGEILDYDYHPPLDASRGSEGDQQQQMPDYYGGERLGQREGWEQYPARR
jgi:hypothetical protein